MQRGVCRTRSGTKAAVWLDRCTLAADMADMGQLTWGKGSHNTGVCAVLLGTHTVPSLAQSR